MSLQVLRLTATCWDCFCMPICVTMLPDWLWLFIKVQQAILLMVVGCRFQNRHAPSQVLSHSDYDLDQWEPSIATHLGTSTLQVVREYERTLRTLPDHKTILCFILRHPNPTQDISSLCWGTRTILYLDQRFIEQKKVQTQLLSQSQAHFTIEAPKLEVEPMLNNRNHTYPSTSWGKFTNVGKRCRSHSTSKVKKSRSLSSVCCSDYSESTVTVQHLLTSAPTSVTIVWSEKLKTAVEPWTSVLVE